MHSLGHHVYVFVGNGVIVYVCGRHGACGRRSMGPSSGGRVSVPSSVSGGGGPGGGALSMGHVSMGMAAAPRLSAVKAHPPGYSGSAGGAPNVMVGSLPLALGDRRGKATTPLGLTLVTASGLSGAPGQVPVPRVSYVGPNRADLALGGGGGMMGGGGQPAASSPQGTARWAAGARWA